MDFWSACLLREEKKFFLAAEEWDARSSPSKLSAALSFAMLPQSKRVTRSLFKELGSRAMLRSPLFDVSYVRHDGDGPRVACVISKKRAPRAVDRNKLRRKAYQAFTESGFSKPYILIIYPRAEALRAPHKDAVVQLSEILATLR